MSQPPTLQQILQDLTRDYSQASSVGSGSSSGNGVGGNGDVVQYCADWFQSRLRSERLASQNPSTTTTTSHLPSSTTTTTQSPSTPSNPPTSRKFPNFPTMSLPPHPGQGQANPFSLHGAQPSPFSEHGPSDSPFGNFGGGGNSWGQRRATMAAIGAGGGGAFGSNAGFGGGVPAQGQGFGAFSMGRGAGAGAGRGGLGSLAEDVSPDQEVDDPTSSFGQVGQAAQGQQPGGDATSSFAAFTFNVDGQGTGSGTVTPQQQQIGGGGADDGLAPPTYALGRRTSVSAESIVPTSSPYGKSGYPSEDPSNPTILETDESSSNIPPSARGPPKTPSQLDRIKSAISQNFLFRNLDEEQEKDVLAAMNEVEVRDGEVVIEQGAAGDYFYVIEGGEFEIFKNDVPGAVAGEGDERERRWGKRVFTAKAGGSFGELALMYNAPRAATVVAKGDGTLWSLDRISFRTILLDHTSRKRRMYETFLASVPILASLEPYERAKIADALESRTFAPGEAVINEGEPGDDFYLIENGVATVEKSGSGVIGELSKGDYFGELALLNRAPRAATVRAGPGDDNKLKVAALGEKAFTRLLGPVREIMARKAGEMYGSSGAYRS